MADETTYHLLIISSYNKVDYPRKDSLESIFKACGLFQVVSREYRPSATRIGGLVFFFKALRIALFHPANVVLFPFRSYWLYLLFRLSPHKRKLILDQMVDPIHWLTREMRVIKPKSHFAKLASTIYRIYLGAKTLILVDTPETARSSASLHRLPSNRLLDIPVGGKETIFGAIKRFARRPQNNEVLEILYYAADRPLHGLEIVAKAVSRVQNECQFRLTLIGFDLTKPENSESEKIIRELQALGRQITVLPRVDIRELSRRVANCDLGLAGPFGNTPQARNITTGKTFDFLASGKPVIIGQTSNNGFLKDGYDAIAVDLGNIEQLARALEWAVNNRDEISRIGENGLKTYKHGFSSAAIAKHIRPKLSDWLQKQSLPSASQS